MTLASHFRWGYIGQATSLLLLVLVNVVLPKTLGVKTFARLSEFNGYLGLTTAIFHEGVTLLTIRRVSVAGDKSAQGVSIAWQSALENVIIVAVMTASVIGLSHIVLPEQHYGFADWALLGVTAVVVAGYPPCVAWMVARKRNDLVAKLTLMQGVLSLMFPLVLFAFGGDVRLSAGLSYLPCLAISIAIMHRLEPIRSCVSLRDAQRICLRPSVIGASAPTMISVGLQSLPVVVLTAQNDLERAVGYKIGLSLAMGILGFVPVSRRTMLAVVDRVHGKVMNQLAGGWVLTAGVGGAVMVGQGAGLVHLVYGQDFGVVAQMVPALGYFVVLQAVADVLLVIIITMGLSRILLAACAMAIATLVVSLLIVPAEWVPVVTLVIFIGSLLVLHPGSIQGSSLALYAGGLGVVGCGLAGLTDGATRIAGPVAVLCVGAITNVELRRAVVAFTRQFLQVK